MNENIYLKSFMDFMLLYENFACSKVSTSLNWIGNTRESTCRDLFSRFYQVILALKMNCESELAFRFHSFSISTMALI